MRSNVADFFVKKGGISIGGRQKLVRGRLKVALITGPSLLNRLPFFKALSQLYHFTIYYTDTFSAEGWLEGINHEMFRRYPRDRPSISLLQGDIFAPGLIPRLVFSDHDVVVGGLLDIVSFFVTKIRRKPFLLWSETWHFSERESVAFRLVRPFFRFVISHSDAVLVPTQMHKAETISLGARGTKTFIMPNVCSMYVVSSDYRKAEELRSRFALKGRRTILYVGRLVESKGVQYLIEAFAKLAAERDDIALICVGDGPFREQLELQCTELRIDERVLFSGPVDRDIKRNAYVVPYFLLCDVCVVPSIFQRGMPDPCPIVVNEAMNCGKAVIATTAAGSAYDMIKNGINGFVVPEKDSAALYDAVKAVLADPATAKAMGEASKKVVEAGFTFNHMVSGFQSAISSLNVAD
ncbi:MAG: glycosyltransferase family 4 protein [Halobacteriota archaeon]